MDKYHKKITDTFTDFILGGIPYSELSVSKICKRADVARGTFYSKYDKLDDLLIEVIMNQYSNFKLEQGKIQAINGIKNTINFINKNGFLTVICKDTKARKVFENLVEHNIRNNIISVLSGTDNDDIRDNKPLLFFSKISREMIFLCLEYELDESIIDDFFNGFTMGDVSLVNLIDKHITERNP